jgi:hypothetical protein
MIELLAVGLGGLLIGGAIACWIISRQSHHRQTLEQSRMLQILESKEQQHQQRLRIQIEGLQTQHHERTQHLFYLMRQVMLCWQDSRTQTQHDKRAIAQADRQTHRQQQWVKRLQTQLETLQTDYHQAQDQIIDLQSRLSQSETDRARIQTELDETIQFWQDPSHYQSAYNGSRAHDNETVQNLTETLKAFILNQTDLKFNTVLEAVELAEQLFPNQLEIWESARESADAASGFRRPHDVFKALRALIEVGERYFENDGTLGHGFYPAFQDYGFVYVDKESETTQANRRLRRERMFRHNGRSKVMMKHLKVGTGKGENTLRLYFDFNLDTQKIEVGHCGAHLTTRSIQ